MEAICLVRIRVCVAFRRFHRCLCRQCTSFEQVWQVTGIDFTHALPGGSCLLDTGCSPSAVFRIRDEGESPLPRGVYSCLSIPPSPLAVICGGLEPMPALLGQELDT